jgi:spermidine synthase
VNLLSRRKDFRQSVKRLEEAFDGRAIAFPSCDSGNAIALGAGRYLPRNAVRAQPPLDELKAAATHLKQETGLNLLPTLARLANRATWPAACCL